MLAALNLGHFGVKLHASDDAGASWREVATPTCPEQPKDAPGVPWKLVQVWVLERAGRTLWAGTIPGGLFRSEDGGTSFEVLREGLPQRDCYDLVYRHGLDVARDGRSLLMGSTTGHLWASDDAGDTWQAVALNLRPICAVRFG